jgi:hypothetical protein
MTPRWRAWLIGMLAIAVVIAALYIPILKRHMRQSAQIPQQSEEQARRELTQPLVKNTGEPMGKARLFWSSGAGDGSLMPVTVDLPLPGDPVLRAKLVLNTLLAGPADPDLRTLPPDGVLLAFYLLPDGTGIADFSEALATATPSGIESEQMAVDSMTKTLEANVPQVRWLKILIHGQETETLAGHLDLTRTFLVNGKAAPLPAAPDATPDSAKTSASAGRFTDARAPGAVEKLTPASATVKLAPDRKP